MQEGLQQRLSKQAIALVRRYWTWFIQFPRFSYLRVSEFEGPPYRLLKYLIDKMVLLEVTWQTYAIGKILRDKKFIGVSFRMMIGDNDVYFKTPT